MRVIGKRREARLQLHWPTEAEARFTEHPPGTILLRGRRGVVRYRSHAEADADMRSLIADELAARGLAASRR